jgi:hypothetical protein
MKKRIIAILLFLPFLPVFCSAIDFKELGDKLEQFGINDALKTVGIDLDRVTYYLNWDNINLSLKADMANTTETLGRKVQIDSKVYKKGLSRIRINVKGDIQIPRAQSPVMISNSYMLRYPIKKEAYLVLPLKKAYMKLDPEKSREMLGQLKERLDEKSGKIEKKEIIGTEELDGYLCDKAHVIMTLANGTRCDITAWLAKDLKGFPIKIILQYETPRGVTGTNTTVFKNIEKTEPEDALFEIPEDYIKCDNIIELATGGKFGSKIKKRKGKGKLFRRK